MKYGFQYSCKSTGTDPKGVEGVLASQNEIKKYILMYNIIIYIYNIKQIGTYEITFDYMCHPHELFLDPFLMYTIYV